MAAAAFAWINFLLMDLWYHGYLKAAVAHAEDVEDRFEGVLPGIGLSRAISKASRMGSLGRLYWFYGIGLFMLGIIVAGLSVAGPARQVGSAMPA